MTFIDSSVKFIDLKNSIKLNEFFKQYTLHFTLIYPHFYPFYNPHPLFTHILLLYSRIIIIILIIYEKEILIIIGLTKYICVILWKLNYPKVIFLDFLSKKFVFKYRVFSSGSGLMVLVRLVFSTRYNPSLWWPVPRELCVEVRPSTDFLW